MKYSPIPARHPGMPKLKRQVVICKRQRRTRFIENRTAVAEGLFRQKNRRIPAPEMNLAVSDRYVPASERNPESKAGTNRHRDDDQRKIVSENQKSWPTRRRGDLCVSSVRLAA